MAMCVDMCVMKYSDNQRTACGSLFFSHVGLRSQTEVIRFGSEYLYPEPFFWPISPNLMGTNRKTRAEVSAPGIPATSFMPL